MGDDEAKKRLTNFLAWLDDIRFSKSFRNPKAIPQQVDWVPRDNHQTLLTAACMSNREDLARFLLEDCKANIDAVDSDGWTTLMCIANTMRLKNDERRSMMEFLLRHGANRSVQSTRRFIYFPAGSDVKSIAMREGLSECVELLSAKEPPPAPPAPPLK